MFVYLWIIEVSKGKLEIKKIGFEVEYYYLGIEKEKNKYGFYLFVSSYFGFFLLRYFLFF